MIRHREGNELIINNLKLYRFNVRHKNYYVIAITFVGLAFTSFFNSFVHHHIQKGHPESTLKTFDFPHEIFASELKTW